MNLLFYSKSQLYVTSREGVNVVLLTEPEIRTGKEKEEEEEEEGKESSAKCQMLCITEIPVVLKGTSHRLCF